MKRQNNIIEKIILLDNLYLAWYKAKKSKINKPYVIEFENNLQENLQNIQNQILTGDVIVGDYGFFYVYEPKKRKISAAKFSERVLHHSIMNICHPFFEKNLIYHTYATRKNKGTYAALDKAKVGVKKYKYYAKLDIRKYFDSIDHSILKQKLRSVFKDPVLIKIFDKIINSYQVEINKGLPIGNLTSQYFANHFLSSADHFLIEKIRIPLYIRYMDDMLLFDNDLNRLKYKVKQFTGYIKENLLLNFKTVNINKTSLGVPFLGYKLFPYTVKLNKKSKKRFKKKIRIYNNLLKKGKWSEKDYQRHITPLIAFTEYADALNFRKNIIFGK